MLFCVAMKIRRFRTFYGSYGLFKSPEIAEILDYLAIFGTQSYFSRVLTGVRGSNLVVSRQIHVILCGSEDSAISHFLWQLRAI